MKVAKPKKKMSVADIMQEKTEELVISKNSSARGGEKIRFSCSADLNVELSKIIAAPSSIVRYWKLIDHLGNALGYSATEMAQALSISRPTVDRKRKAKETLTEGAENRVHRLISLYARARYYFGSDKKVRSWMTSEIRALGMNIPKKLAAKEPGTEGVITVLQAMEEGAYA